MSVEFSQREKLLLIETADIVPEGVYRSVIKEFKIPKAAVYALAKTVRASRPFKDRKALLDECNQRRERAEAYEHVILIINNRYDELIFLPEDDGMKTSFESSLPDFSSPPAVWHPQSLLVDMLAVLVKQEKIFLKAAEAELADREALGGAVKLARFTFWFPLLGFWHHRLAKPLATSTDPITGKPGGPLIRFLLAMSEHAFRENMPTPQAVRKFVRQHKERVEADPNFAGDRLLPLFREMAN